MIKPIEWMETGGHDHEQILADLLSHCDCSEPEHAGNDDPYFTTAIHVGTDVWTLLTKYPGPHRLLPPEKHTSTSYLHCVRFGRIDKAIVEWNKIYQTMRKEQQYIVTTFFTNAEILQTEYYETGLLYGLDDFQPIVEVAPLRHRIKGKQYTWDLITSALRRHTINIVF